MVTAVGCPGFVEIFNALKQNRTYEIIGTDINNQNAGAYIVDKFYSVPHGDNSDYMKIINNIVIHEDIEAILPEATPELIPLSRSLYAVVSPTNALEKTIDKGRMLGCVGSDLAPSYKVVKTAKEMERAVNELGYPTNAVVIKPCVADGSRGLRILSPHVDKVKVFLDKPNSIMDSWAGIKATIYAADRCVELPKYLVMEYLQGNEYSVDCIPELNVAVVRVRNEIRNGIAWRSHVVRLDKLSNMALDICSKLGLKYNINIQLKEDDHYGVKILEVNPRVSGTIVACTKAGINLPNLAIKKFLGKPIRPKELEYKTGALYRYWGGVWNEGD